MSDDGDRTVREAATTRPALPWFRAALGVAGLVLLAAIVRSVGVDLVVATLRPALPWVVVLAAVELLRIGCAATASYLAFGRIARRIPKATLFRAHLVGHSISAVAPAPTVFNETIKATLITPYTGAGPAAAVGFTNQAATLMSNGLISIPCGVAFLVLKGPSIWFWACAVHAVVLMGSGLALQAATRADAPGRWLVRRFPSVEERARAFRDHARGIALGARGPTLMLLVFRSLQIVQYAIAGHAVGMNVDFVRVVATEGVHLVAAAVGVLVPGGFGTTEGAFTLAADVLDTTVARATALALLMRCMQLVWVAVGSTIALVTRGEARRS
ncbi:MAG: flippase-like domain-containing protein [Labilithrix sp.]|nr:flippase-like domain-containing protein [Labilithrix sp.]